MPLQIGIGYSTTFWNPQSPLLEDEDRAGERDGNGITDWNVVLYYPVEHILMNFEYSKRLCIFSSHFFFEN
jgi:hypothetical protein